MEIFRKLLRVLTRDLTGRTWEQESDHPYFGRVIYFGHEDPDRAYWEAEVGVDAPPGKVSVTMSGTPDGPTAEEEAFCRRTLSDLDSLFELCRGVFESEYERWTSRPMPTHWRDTFELDGISVPPSDDPSRSWEVTYFVHAANHWFTAHIVNGRADRASVDG